MCSLSRKCNRRVKPDEDRPGAGKMRTGIVELANGRVRRIVENDWRGWPSNISSLPLYVFSERIMEALPEVRPSPNGEYELPERSRC